jgi:hypothetical protein
MGLAAIDASALIAQSFNKTGEWVVFRKAVGIIVMSLGIAAAAHAVTGRPMSVLQNYDTSVTQAPEIDPASAFSALTFLAGGLTVLRGRRTKK